MSFIIIRCGSAARGDTNSNSDTDTVCIWEGIKPNFTEIKKTYKGIMFYSSDTIRRMRKMNSLFLTHLDIDGIYLAGNKNLTKLYKGFKPDSISLQKNSHTTKEFIREIKWYPNNIHGMLWIMDVLYVATRNIIFCENAIKGNFIFGYEAALNAFGLRDAEIQSMLKIREGKYDYRKNNPRYTHCQDSHFLSETASMITGLHISLTAGGKTSFDRSKNYNYWTERLIERAIINNEINAPHYITAMKNHNYNKTKLKIETKKLILQLTP